MIEKAQIEALIEKHRLLTPKTPDEVNKSGTGKNAIEKGQEGTKKGRPPYKQATKDIQIKKSHKKGTEATNAKKGKSDTLIGDPIANTATGIEKAKEKGQKDKIGIDNIGIFCNVLLLLRLAIWWTSFVLLVLSVLNFWGMFVRVYPKIVQGLTFLNSVKHITIILARCTS